VTQSLGADTTADGPKISLPELGRHVGLFLAAGASMGVTYARGDEGGWKTRLSWVHGAEFAGALLLILLAHELGHYVAARIHKVESSLPYFIPLPILSPFGTMGAVIRMRGKVPSRRALLDIGAAGPLAGLVFAIPMYAWGTRHSKVVPLDPTFTINGESILTRLLDAVFGPHLAAGEVQLASPLLFAAWAGFFVTMLNLIPIGQLDGGHVAFALLGRKQDRASVVVHRSLLAFFFVGVVASVFRDVRGGMGLHHLGRDIGDALFWLVWFLVLGALAGFTKTETDDREPTAETVSPWTRIAGALLLSVIASEGRSRTEPVLWAGWFLGLGLMLMMEARGGTLRDHTLFDHPDVGRDDLGWGRTVIGWVTLAFFALLFMPVPFAL
jgi:Zn-dependent protease